MHANVFHSAMKILYNPENQRAECFKLLRNFFIYEATQRHYHKDNSDSKMNEEKIYILHAMKASNFNFPCAHARNGFFPPLSSVFNSLLIDLNAFL